MFWILPLGAEGKQKDRENLIEMIKLCYRLQGKGKNRKRKLSEVLEIVENKTIYFDNLIINKEIQLRDLETEDSE